jgi:lipopolysaccharide biosynthesis regulator YciM
MDAAELIHHDVESYIRQLNTYACSQANMDAAEHIWMQPSKYGCSWT